MLEVDESARRWLAKEGYDERMGARPMQRLIQEKVKKPLAEDLLFGDLVNGGTVHVTLEDGELKEPIAMLRADHARWAGGGVARPGAVAERAFSDKGTQKIVALKRAECPRRGGAQREQEAQPRPGEHRARAGVADR